ncbi:MAG: hypothetical protein ABI186_08770 [Candidatus Elarobacter sp.]
MTPRTGFTLAGVLAAAAALPLLAACGGGGGTMSTPPVQAMPAMPAGTTPAPVQMLDVRATTAADRAQDERDRDDRGAVLPSLELKTIGSTVDPLNGDQNPYGLDIAPVDAGLLHRGDLVVCNFNDAANVQGNGTTLIALRPHSGATPVRIEQSTALGGCTALALGPTDNIWSAAFVANDNPIVSPSGALLTTIPGGPWHHPFGQTFSAKDGPFGDGAFYESNAGDGSIVRINLTAKGFTFDVIATGFAVNGGAPGGILGPSGLQYDEDRDALDVIDGADNSVAVLRHVSRIPAHGVIVHGTTFGGPAAAFAHRIFAGPPLNGPISAALLPGGHLVIGNTLDPNGTNLMVEITAGGRVVATRNVDTGAAGALFGMVANRRDRDDVRLYFNDDNDNTVKLLSR